MSKELLKKIRYELVTTNGLYATDSANSVKKERFQLNHKDLIKEIDEAIIKYDEEKKEYPQLVLKTDGTYEIHIEKDVKVSFDTREAIEEFTKNKNFSIIGERAEPKPMICPRYD